MGRGCSGIADVLDSDSVISIPVNMEVTDLEIVDEELQTITLDAEVVTEKNEVKEDKVKDIVTPSCSFVPTTPLWKRHRPTLLKEKNQQQGEVVATLCTEFQGVNKKKIEIEDLKKKLLEEEMEFKRNLYNLQLESARKDLEIKIEVLNQIQAGNFHLQNLFGVPKND